MKNNDLQKMYNLKLDIEELQNLQIVIMTERNELIKKVRDERELSKTTELNLLDVYENWLKVMNSIYNKTVKITKKAIK